MSGSGTAIKHLPKRAFRRVRGHHVPNRMIDQPPFFYNREPVQRAEKELGLKVPACQPSSEILWLASRVSGINQTIYRLDPHDSMFSM